MTDNNIKNLRAGDLLFIQGEKPSSLFLLQKGTLEILSCPDEYEGLDREIILSKSTRVGLLKGKTLIAGLSRKLVEPCRMSVRALEDSIVSQYPLRPGGFHGMVTAAPDQAITLLRHLFRLITDGKRDFARNSNMMKNVCIINDNFSIMYKSISDSCAPDSLHARAEEAYSGFSRNGGNVPDTFTAKFLITDNSSLIGRCYETGEGFISDSAVMDFAGRLLRVDAGIFRTLIAADPEIAVGMYDLLTDRYLEQLFAYARLSAMINTELTSIFGDSDSWLDFLVSRGGFDEWLARGSITPDFLKNLLSLVVKLNVVYEEISGKRITDRFPVLKKLHQYYIAHKETGVPGKGRDTAAPAAVPGGVMKRSIYQIFEFALVEKDFQNKMLKLMNDFKKMKNPFSTESDGRKLRRSISRFYWDLYKQVYIRSRKESSVPRAVRFMLNFGFLDDELVEDSQIAELNDLARLRERTDIIPVMLETEFLNRIYSGKEEPSITEMGLSYEAFVREEEKHKKKREREKAAAMDDNVRKVLYEIDQRLKSTAAVCSGSTSTAFPILTSQAVKGSLKSIYTSKNSVERIVTDVRNIDFSVFFRETVLKLGEAREIIKEEVLPYIVLLPICGSKTLLWQDLSGTNKRSRGRIVVPIFFIGDLQRNLTHSLACFRWELSRSMKGAMWSDPIEGGITGEYFDYVNTFKKNSKLSVEAKEKLNERFKSLRTNRDRFADDYIMWVMYEKDGIMKLNNVVRDMFYKHIPFKKDIRARLENMPAFSHPANRFKNVHAKEVQALQRRFKKYQNEQGSHPDAIEKFFTFLDM